VTRAHSEAAIGRRQAAVVAPCLPVVSAPDHAMVEAVVRRLEAAHGTKDLGNRADPVEELVFIPLTRQTHRQNSLRSWAAIEALGGPAALLAMPEEELAALLKDGGFSRQKAGWIKRSLELIVERFERLSLEGARGWSDADVEGFLCTLPGIKVKSARCVMMYSMGRLVLPVDTHLRRLVERLGWVARGLSERRIHAELDRLVEPALRVSLHVNAIWHGRAVCRALRPRCSECVVQRSCGYGTMAVYPSTPEHGESPERLWVMEHA
jgi:endonuclease III